ncbi:hypothetical protein [Nocardia sputorum]|uniref:Uncharacterized protein n=1 Tax=Nocardia sputorum TaxID=2984338 RepID=A0ABM8CXN3_9NOCA|nr:hypothetical protein [Nocardia sputorum]BDT99766.1 hypothetical protein IFM12276_27950 [Nocardia sputorum]
MIDQPILCARAKINRTDADPGAAKPMDVGSREPPVDGGAPTLTDTTGQLANRPSVDGPTIDRHEETVHAPDRASSIDLPCTPN